LSIKLISVGTVEERIQALQARKQALADGLYDSRGGANPRWTEEDVEELFRPLL
jgi:SNF2 family DNA or RNA helicase